MLLKSFRARAMLTLILASILVVLVLGGVWLYSTKEYIENEIHASDMQDCRHMAESVNMYLNDITSNIEIAASSHEAVTAFQKNDTGQFAQIADILRENNPKPDAVVAINETGHVLYGTKDTDLTNIRAFYWYGDMVKNNGPYITGLYLSPPLKQYAFAILMPVRSNDTIIGRIMVVYTPENFHDSLKEHSLDPRNNVIIVDGNGDVLSSNDLSVVNTNTNISAYTPVQKVIHNETGGIVHGDSWDGQPHYSSYLPIPRSGWGVIVSTPLSVEYRPLYEQLEWILGMLVLFIIAFSIFGYFASKYLTHPIVNLSNAMGRVSAGDYRSRVAVRRKDEIGELACTFNSMMDKLEEARSRSDMYLDLMGHDINNMNQVALGYLEMADELIGSGGSVGKSDEILIKKPMAVLEDSTNLINNVQKLQRVRTEAMRTDAVDLNKILSELIDQYSHVPGRDIRIDFERRGECRVYANELVKDVFSNLIWNAIKHTDPEKPLRIRLAIGEVIGGGVKYYEVSVDDNGHGIDDAMKKKLFSRFGRGKTKAKGSGLGLYLVKTLVDGFGGSVRVEDRVRGDRTQGSRFVVMLPAVNQ